MTHTLYGTKFYQSSVYFAFMRLLLSSYLLILLILLLFLLLIVVFMIIGCSFYCERNCFKRLVANLYVFHFILEAKPCLIS